MAVTHCTGEFRYALYLPYLTCLQIIHLFTGKSGDSRLLNTSVAFFDFIMTTTEVKTKAFPLKDGLIKPVSILQ